jgi:predicted nucleic acid-binding protein
MLRVTLDSNAYISALQFNGRATRLLRMASDNGIEIAILKPIIAEVIGVFRERFGWDD